MARLPTVGGDAGNWGDVLNDYLSQSHNADGSLKTDSIGAPQLKSQSVTNAALADGTIAEGKLSSAVQTKLNASTTIADGSVTTDKLADGSVTNAKLASAGATNGVATLDGDAKLPESQVPERLGEEELNSKIAEEAALATASLAAPMPIHRGLLTGIDKARTDHFTVALYGMSIADNEASLAYVLGALLRQEYGTADPIMQINGFKIGGSYTNTVNGDWRKQPASCPPYGRIRGSAAATSGLTWTLYCDTVKMYFSRESNSEAADILIDGVVVGQTPSGGAQQLTILQTFTVTPGAHTITINKPTGAGYVYFEWLTAFDSSVHGVHVLQQTLGGSTLGNMMTAAAGGSGQVASIATVGEAGLLAHFDRPDVDAFVVQHDVNDAGSGDSYMTNTFEPLLERILEITRDAQKPVVFVSSMAGHYSMSNDNGSPGNHTRYERIRSLYRQAAIDHSHVTHLDWHEATRMDDIAAYAARYYPSVAALNVAAGTYTGDFIHPVDLGHQAAQQLAAKSLSVPAPIRTGSNKILLRARTQIPRGTTYPPVKSETTVGVGVTSYIDGGTDTFTTATPHGLSTGQAIVLDSGISGVTGLGGGTRYYVVNVPTTSTFQVSTTLGGPVLDFSGTSSSARPFRVLDTRRFSSPGGLALMTNGSYSVATTPFYQDRLVGPSLWNRVQAQMDEIEASSTSDENGKYVDYTNKNLSFGQVAVGSSLPMYLVFRAAGAGGTGTFSVRSNSANALAKDGADLGTSVTFSVDNVTEPVWGYFPFWMSAINQYITITGRFYECYVSYGTVPVIP